MTVQPTNAHMEIAPTFSCESALEHPDILFTIFMHIVNNTQQIFWLSLVNKSWHEVTMHPHLWQKICYQTGIPVPFNINHSYNACRYAQSSLFLEQIKQCKEPKIEVLDLGMNIAEHKVHFVEDLYTVVQTQFEAIVLSQTDATIINRISAQTQILSLCVSQTTVFICFEDRRIEARSLLEPNENPLFTLDGHSDDDFSKDLFPDFKIKICGNNNNLVTCSSKKLKLWDITSGRCVAERPTWDTRSLQIDRNKLYKTDLMMREPSYVLASFNLDRGDLNYDSQTIVSSPHIAVNGNSFSYIENPPKYAYRFFFLDGEEDITDSLHIKTRSFKSRDEVQFTRLTTNGMFKQKYLKIFKGLAIVGDDDFNHNEIQDTEAPQQPDIISLIDCETEREVHRIQKHHVHSSESGWSISFFQGTLLYVTEDNKFVKVTFPPKEKNDTKKRIAAEDTEQNFAKKQRLQGEDLEQNIAKKRKALEDTDENITKKQRVN